MAENRILVVEDESIIAADIKESLQNLGYAVTSIASSGEEAIKKAQENNPDLVLMDIMLRGEMDGIETASRIRFCFNIPVVYLTAYSDEKLLERAKITEPFGYIIKPFNERELHTNIEIALYKHKMEKKLKESEQWLSVVIESLGEAVIATDKIGNIRIMNPFAEALTGWKQEEASGKPLTTVFNIKSEGRSVEDAVTKVIREGIYYGLADNTFLVSKEGIKIPVDIIGSLIKDNRDNIIGTVLIFNDITERKKAEEIRRQNEMLAYASKAKSEFLANMSHELRTPLNAIIGFSELMKMNIEEPNLKKRELYVENILKSSRHLLALINDILDLSKVEAGKVELVKEKLPLPETISEVVSLIKERAAKHNVVVEKEIEPGLDIEADRQRFMQVLFNLLSNAVKFSKEEGGIVTIKAEKDGDMVHISVSDTGIGIREEDMKRLFSEFEQLDSGISRKYEGTGLGLAITKKLVELHGGKIWAESKYGEGSIFAFLLPAKKEN